jgi:hypothetical protein
MEESAYTLIWMIEAEEAATKRAGQALAYVAYC